MTFQDQSRPPRRSSLPAALLDLRFEQHVTPILVKWIYAGVLAVVGFGVLFGLLWVWSLAVWIGWAMWLAAPIVLGLGLIALLTARVACERVMVRYRSLPAPALYPVTAPVPVKEQAAPGPQYLGRPE
ncbi:hypothetical protein [Actinomadura xylanilytica]|uniref:hypothetical protein n=1 Tax=Actinomadura xylanilytica TaxID=887459 RepID=UPI00255B17AC|nr:hypothetical protein [Actinomadura xylanilytica]MDL4776364.1 hypothetical protein [Actinomadura xylanilytica]